MAPSSTTMRLLSSSRKAAARAACHEGSNRDDTLAGLYRCLGALRPQPERVADRKGELGTIQRIEVELFDALTLQRLHLLDGHGGGDQPAGFRILLESGETLHQPGRNVGAATGGKFHDRC